MDLMVELLGVGQLKVILHGGVVAYTHKVVVPARLCRNHEESQEAITEQHLHTLIVGGEVTLRVVACVLVLSPPLIARGSQLVGCEGAGAWGEAACDNHSLLPVPGRVVSHDLGVGADVLGCQLGQLVGLSVDPS